MTNNNSENKVIPPSSNHSNTSNNSNNNNNNKNNSNNMELAAHSLFGPEIGKVYTSYTCTYHTRFSGRLYVSERALCFYSNLFTFEKMLCLNWTNVLNVSKASSRSGLRVKMSKKGRKKRGGGGGVGGVDGVGGEEEKEEGGGEEEDFVFRNLGDSRRDEVYDMILKLWKKTENNNGRDDEDDNDANDDDEDIAEIDEDSVTNANKQVTTPKKKKIRCVINRVGVDFQQPLTALLSPTTHKTLGTVSTATVSTATGSDDESELRRKRRLMGGLDDEFRRARRKARMMARTRRRSISWDGGYVVRNHRKGVLSPRRNRSDDELDPQEDDEDDDDDFFNEDELEHHANAAARALSPSSLTDDDHSHHHHDHDHDHDHDQHQNVVDEGQEEAFQQMKKSLLPNFKSVALEECHLFCTLDTFYQTFLSDDAPHSIHSYQTDVIHDTDIITPPWKPTSPSSSSRSVTFRHPVNVPMGPSHSDCTKIQQLHRFDPYGIILVNSTTLAKGTPGAGTFTADELWILEHKQQSKSPTVSWSVRSDIKFVKTTMFKKMIEKGTKAETLKWYAGYKHMVMDVLDKNPVLDAHSTPPLSSPSTTPFSSKHHQQQQHQEQQQQQQQQHHTTKTKSSPQDINVLLPQKRTERSTKPLFIIALLLIFALLFIIFTLSSLSAEIHTLRHRIHVLEDRVSQLNNNCFWHPPMKTL